MRAILLLLLIFPAACSSSSSLSDTNGAGGGAGASPGGSGGSGGSASHCTFDSNAGTCTTSNDRACCTIVGMYLKLDPATGCYTKLPEPNAPEVIACSARDELAASLPNGCASDLTYGCYALDQPDGATMFVVTDSHYWQTSEIGPGYRVCSDAEKEPAFVVVSKGMPMGAETCP